MEAHQERVITEKTELDEKVRKLDQFLLGALFNTLPQAERGRLVEQSAVMRRYAEILADRIAAF